MIAERTILIVGASGRAAAQSAKRAGWQPIVIDLFNDADTAECGPMMLCPFEEYPHGFVELAMRAPPGPWMYTGGLENYPEVVAAISRQRELFGVPPTVLERIRDPIVLSRHVPMPEIRQAHEDRQDEIRWLRKPYRSAGGIGIEIEPVSGCASDTEGHYWQEYRDGISHSALVLFHAHRTPELVGVCSQLIGESWLYAPPFQYCGNIGPLPVGKHLKDQLVAIACSLAAFDLRGLIGIDFLLHEGDTYVLEVNPRYTASVELYERATGEPLLARHIESFDPVTAQTSPPSPLSEAERGDKKIHGKAILYAERDFVVRENHPWRGPTFADIPRIGTMISTGQPVVTLFAAGDTETECRERLMELAKASAHP